MKKIIKIIIPALLTLFALVFSISAIYRYKGEAILYKINSGNEYNIKELQILLNNHQKAKNVINSGEVNNDIALAWYLTAKKEGITTEQGKEFLQQAETSQIESLKKSPANPYGWLRLAKIQLFLKKPDEETANSLYMSAITAPYDYNIINYRLKLAMVVWEGFDDDEKSYMKSQIKINWEAYPVQTALGLYAKKDIVKDAIGIETKKLILEGEIDPNFKLNPKPEVLSEEIEKRASHSKNYLKLACISYLENGRGSKTAEYIKKSIESDPYITTILIPRLQLAVINWDYFDEEGLELVKKQIKRGWTNFPATMEKIFANSKRVVENK